MNRLPSIALLSLCSLATPAIGQNILNPFQKNDEPKWCAVYGDDIYVTPIDYNELKRVRNLDEILASLENITVKAAPVNRLSGPWVFSGYRSVGKKSFMPDNSRPMQYFEIIDGNIVETDSVDSPEILEAIYDVNEDERDAEPLDPWNDGTMWYKPGEIDILGETAIPKWLHDAMTSYRIQDNLMYLLMVYEPHNIDYAYWGLPVPPRLPEDDVSFAAYIKKLNLPSVDLANAEIPDQEVGKIHWLHKVGSALQFSQAYMSENWYQGGDRNLSLLFNFLWNVQLNQVYHPNLLFESNLQYKLGMVSTPSDEFHNYILSEDLFQYNMNAGLKAFKKWFYSLNTVFKTQIFNSYKTNSEDRRASFLSPGSLNIGLGMAYSHQNKKKNFQMTATISPLSYNLQICRDSRIDETQFNIPEGHKTHSEIGSNAEININWNILWNLNYKSRLFAFTNYQYFQSDWENTFSFSFNKFLSTQVYVRMRYDTSAPSHSSWGKLQLREVLSFGLTYAFSTKP